MKQFKIIMHDECFPVQYITDRCEAKEFFSSMMKTDILFGLDTETYAAKAYHNIPYAALSPHTALVRLVQLTDGKSIWIIDLLKAGYGEELITFFESNRFVAHHAIFELSHLMHMGVRKADIGCTRILAKLLQHAVYPTDEGVSASLEDLAREILKFDISKANQTSDWGVELIQEQLEYAAYDAIVCYKLAEKLAPVLDRYGLWRIYRLTKAAQAPIAWMQLNGLSLDVEKHHTLTEQWRVNLYEARKELAALTGMETFTAHSIAQYLEKNLDAATLEIWPRTDTGKLAADAHVFADFDYLPIVKPFGKFQKALKLTTTYGKKLLDQRNAATGKLHANYNLCGARTGRLSCSAPNLQQAPRDKDFRSCFIPSPGKVFVCADFSQIEIRIGAELSRDSAMLRAYREGIDIHALTAATVAKKPLSEVTKDDRQLAKAVNFGLMFGLGAAKFSHYAKKSYGVDVSHEAAVEAVDTFRELYAGYREWQLNQAETSAKTMTVRTPMGKLRKLNHDTCYGGSMNTPIQGGAAEIMLLTLIGLFEELFSVKEYGAALVNCVHDEVLVECWPEQQGEVKRIVEECMTCAYLHVFPTGIVKDLVSAGIGPNWAQAKD